MTDQASNKKDVKVAEKKDNKEAKSQEVKSSPTTKTKLKASQWIALLLILLMTILFIKDYKQFAASEVIHEWPTLKGEVSWIGLDDLKETEAKYVRGNLYKSDIRLTTTAMMFDWYGTSASAKGTTGFQIDFYAKKNSVKHTGQNRDKGGRYILKSESPFSISLYRSDVGPAQLDFSYGCRLAATSMSVSNSGYQRQIDILPTIDSPFNLIFQAAPNWGYYRQGPYDEFTDGKFGEALVEHAPQGNEWIDPSVQRIRKIITSEEPSASGAADVRQLAALLDQTKAVESKEQNFLQKIKQAEIAYEIEFSPLDIQISLPVVAVTVTVHEFGTFMINGKIKNTQGGIISYAFSPSDPAFLIIDGTGKKLRLTGKAIGIKSDPAGVHLDRKIEMWEWYWQALFWFVFGVVFSVLVKV